MRRKGLRSQNRLTVTAKEDEELRLIEKQNILRITAREAKET
jgi:hypothetical protein